MQKVKHWFHLEEVPIPTFGWKMEIVFTDDPFSYARHKEYQVPEVSGLVSALCVDDHTRMKSILILKLNAEPGTIAHEAWHAVRNMLLGVGAELGSEVVAYHLGYLVGEVYDVRKKAIAYNKRHRAKKKS